MITLQLYQELAAHSLQRGNRLGNRQTVLDFAKISGKQIDADFEGGTLTSDGGVLFLREVEARVGVIRRLAEALPDRRDPRYVDHTLEDLLRQRVFQIACGYEDANDCDELRGDVGIKMACDRLPLSGPDLASQPTMSRLENDPSRTDLYRMARALVDVFIASYSTPPQMVLLDIDDTDDPTHGDQQMTLFNGYYDEHCYLPLHIYEGQSGKLITTLLRPGRRPTGREIVAILNRVVAYLRKAWPKVAIFLRGDSHFSTPEVHRFCEQERVSFVLGQGGNEVLKAKAAGLLEQAQALFVDKQEKIRLFTEFLYQAQSWDKPLRILAKVEVSSKGSNLRFVVTNLHSSQPSFLYDTIYCARGRMEGFIKNHKTFLHSDRTSCHTFEANQFRLFLHSAAYILLHTLAHQGLQDPSWATAQFNTLQLRILKVGARIRELATRIKIHFPSSFPLKPLFQRILWNLAAAYP
jgi:hypothetical protein